MVPVILTASGIGTFILTIPILMTMVTIVWVASRGDQVNEDLLEGIYWETAISLGQRVSF